ncbi:MAG: DUF5683 domain-containing protein [Prevotella sp.]|nr:DUF5683 domain-containing protein [Prevotella sp.]
MSRQIVSLLRNMAVACCMLTFSWNMAYAQNHSPRNDTNDSIPDISISTTQTMAMLSKKDSISLAKAEKKDAKRIKRDWKTWRPSPKKAMWLGIVLPGAGQIYNRKYWKLPIIYGGFVGCIYAMQWNNMMYKDYSQAYLDIMDSDPSTQSYNQFLHLGRTITDANRTQYQNIFKQRKDRYRRWRDLSVFCLIGVYALSIIDAYVDASLSEFDISDDLSLRVEPAVFNNPTDRTPFNSSVLGINCRLSF